MKQVFDFKSKSPKFYGSLLLSSILFFSLQPVAAGECLEDEYNLDYTYDRAKKGNLIHGNYSYYWDQGQSICYYSENKELSSAFNEVLFDSRLHPAAIATFLRQYMDIYNSPESILEQLSQKQSEYNYSVILQLLDEYNSFLPGAYKYKPKKTFDADTDYIDGPANIRDAPGGKVVNSLPDSTEIKILETRGKWFRIAYSDGKAWTYKNNLKSQLIGIHDEDGFTPLARAIYSGNLEVVLFLESKGADIYFVDQSGNNALHWAVLSGFAPMGGIELDMLDHVLSYRDLKVNALGKDGKAAFYWVLIANRIDMLKIILRHEAIDVNSMSHAKDGITPLALAAVRQDREMLAILLDSKKIDVNRADRLGKTALYQAISMQDPGIVKMLVKAGADVNAKTKRGRTLYHALFDRAPYWLPSVELVETVLDLNADISLNSNDDKGDTVLSLAKKYSFSNKNDIVNLLMSAGAK